MNCKESEDGNHDFDELSECVMCGYNKLHLCYEELYSLIKQFDLSESQKNAISFVITYSSDITKQYMEVSGNSSQS